MFVRAPRALLLSTFACLLCAISSAADDAERICSHALQLQQSGNLAAAISEYQACIALRPKDPLVRSNLGAVLAATGKLDDAIATYQVALAMADTPQLRRNLAVTYYQARNYQQAAVTLEPLEAAGVKDLPITLLLADCRLRLGQDQKVIDALTPLEFDPREPKAIAYLLGTALVHHGDETRGRQLLARQTLPDTAQTRFLAAKALFDEGNFPAAVTAFARAIELDPNLPTLQSFYGQALLFTGDPDAASAAFQRELAHHPDDFEANLKLGSILQFRHDDTAALPYFQHAVALNPASLEARNGLAKIYSSLGNWDQARRQYEALLAQAPYYRDGHEQLAIVYDKLGRAADAATQRTLASQSSAVTKDDTGLLDTGTAAPDFTLPTYSAAGTISLANLRRDKPTLLIFGSYTCPKFRFDAPALNRLHSQYGDRVNFLLVYVHEAHSGADWKSTANQREGVDLSPATTIDQKRDYATLCKRKLSIRFPSVVDGMDRHVETAYRAWPSAAYLIDINGTIRLRSRLGEQEFAAADLERLIQTLTAK